MNNRYASFKVSAKCNDIDDRYNLEIWSEGVVVRGYYEPRQVGVTGADAGLSTVVLSHHLRF